MNRKLAGAVSVLTAAAIAVACGLSGEGLAPGVDGGHKDGAANGESGAYDQDASAEAGDTEAGARDGTAHDATGAGDGPPDGASSPDGAADGDDTGSADGGDATADAHGDADASGGLDSSRNADADAGAGPDGGGNDGGPADAAPDRVDASADAGACDFNGTWASRMTIDVTWAPQGLTGIILASGSGQIRQWIKGVRVQSGTSTTDATVVCGVQLPDFQSTALASSETYGAVFPNSLFDTVLPDGGAYLPTFTVSAALSGLTPGSTYSTTTTAALLGLTLAHPTTDAWPSTVTTQVDMDQDGKPGVTLEVPTGPQSNGVTYSGVPVGIPALFQPAVRASLLYVAIRQVTVVTGTVQDCSHMTGTVSIPQINGKDGIDSHVLGCQLAAGGECSSTQATFVDNTQPVFTPSGTTDFHSMRLATGATCADVRAALP